MWITKRLRSWLLGLLLVAGMSAPTLADTGMCTNEQFVRVYNHTHDQIQQFVSTEQVFTERWDTLAQVRFWRQVMALGADWTILNRAATREIYGFMCTDDWEALSDNEQKAYRENLRELHCLPKDERIFATTGKNDYYQHEKVMPAISRGTSIFCEEGVDPWYAQAILLIESPGAIHRSPKGALGSFQLMRSVAIKFGLKVNRYRDDRRDFDKSAVAAAGLLSSICIPQTKEMLDQRDICYEEDDLWFRFLVLHVYHAGAGNVKGVVNKIDPEEGNMELIRTLWQTEHGRFRNASQNYSQVALASLLELNDLVYAHCTVDLEQDLRYFPTDLF